MKHMCREDAMDGLGWIVRCEVGLGIRGNLEGRVMYNKLWEIASSMGERDSRNE